MPFQGLILLIAFLIALPFLFRLISRLLLLFAKEKNIGITRRDLIFTVLPAAILIEIIDLFHNSQCYG